MHAFIAELLRPAWPSWTLSIFCLTISPAPLPSLLLPSLQYDKPINMKKKPDPSPSPASPPPSLAHITSRIPLPPLPPSLPSPRAQLLMTFGAKMDLRNNRGQTPYDVCITDGVREILDNYGYKHVVAAGVESAAAAAAAVGGVFPAAADKSDLDHPTVQQPPQRRRQGVPFVYPCNLFFRAVPTYTHVAEGQFFVTPHCVENAGCNLPLLTSLRCPFRKAADEDFPDLGSPAKPSAEISEPDLFSKGPSAFMEEVHGGGDSRFSGLYAGLTPRGRTSPNNSGSGAAYALTTPRVATASTGSMRPLPAPLPPIGGGGGGGAQVHAAGAAAALAASPVDYLEKVREENRRRAAAEATEASLAPRKRPVSANKKFLSKYGLAGSSLFAP